MLDLRSFLFRVLAPERRVEIVSKRCAHRLTIIMLLNNTDCYYTNTIRVFIHSIKDPFGKLSMSHQMITAIFTMLLVVVFDTWSYYATMKPYICWDRLFVSFIWLSFPNGNYCMGLAKITRGLILSPINIVYVFLVVMSGRFNEKHGEV